MSLEARQALVDAPGLFFQIEACKTDLLDKSLTSTYLIELLTYLVIERGWNYELTCVRTGHHDDGPHGHFGGFACDGWPLRTRTAGDWCASTDARFRWFLDDLSRAPALYQVGLAGSADLPANRTLLGRFYFPDSGADHVHIGATDGSF